MPATTLDKMKRRSHWVQQTVDKWKLEREKRDRQRVRDHFAKIKPDLFLPGYPPNVADLVLERVSGETAWYRIISHHCVVCGRKLTTDQAVRLSMGPECYERFIARAEEVGEGSR